MKKIDVLMEWLKNIAIYMLLYIVSILFVVTAMQFINLSINKYTFFISIMVTTIIYYIFKRKKANLKNICFISICSIMIILFTIFFIGKIYDITCDGNTYHKYAVGNLKNGWNPTRESSYDFSVSHNLYPNEKLSLWVDHYAKATWNYGAVIYSLTSNIEAGKSLCLLMAIILFFLLTSYLYNKKFKLYQSILISLLLAFNPIVCSQVFSYYVDGTLGLAIYMTLLFLVIVTDDDYTFMSKLEKYFGLFASILLCINIKFTGMLYAGIFSIVFYIYWLIKANKSKNLFNEFKQKSLFFVITLILSVGYVGYSTYITNTMNNKNPLYPLFGDNKVDIITIMQPAEFKNMNGIKKLFYSLFSKSENVIYTSKNVPQLKIPFTFDKKELKSLSIPDLRIGGYGPLYSGVFVISIILFIYLIIKLLKNKIKLSNKSIIILNILIAIIISTIMMIESWWARYAPQLYLFPILSILIMFYYLNINNKKVNVLVKILLIITIIPLALDSLFVLKYRYDDLNTSKNISTSLYNLKIKSNSEKVKIRLAGDANIGILFDLDDKNISYIVDQSCQGKDTAYSCQIMY